MRTKLVMKGLITYLPGVYDRFDNLTPVGTHIAKQAYKQWIKHLTMLWENGLDRIPVSVAELGPGRSIGMGLSALLSGAKHYFALDVKKYADADHNLMILDELVDLFTRRAACSTDGNPDFGRYLDVNGFPSHILTEERLNAALNPDRVESIKRALLGKPSSGDEISIEYIAPWDDPHTRLPKNTIDLLYSHSVLEHVNDLDGVYKAMASLVEPGGLISHQIDFKSHGYASEWNGYWGYPDWLWKLIVGKRPFTINRQPCSRHTALISDNGFEIIRQFQWTRPSGIERSRLAAQWRDLSESDLTCSGTYVIARKQ